MANWMVIIWEILARMYTKWEVSPRKSIVRSMGSWFPAIKAQRVHIELATWKYELDERCSLPDSLDEGRGSSPTIGPDSTHGDNPDLKKLLEEIVELKSKMNEILQRQDMNRCCSQTACRVSGTASQPRPPPPPPPLPPPPSAVVAAVRTPHRARNRRESPKSDSGLSAVLDELKSSKISLRPILKSPGGRPVRNRSPRPNTSDSLADILRQRLSQTQYSDSDCSSVYSDFLTSPDRTLNTSTDH